MKHLEDSEINFENIKNNYKINFNQMPRTEFIYIKFNEMLDRFLIINCIKNQLNFPTPPQGIKI